MRVALVVVLALALAAAASSSGELPADVEKCAAGEARAVVVRFVAAFNARDLSELDLVFSPAESFVWYATGPPGVRRSPVSRDRSTLLPYFSERHRAGERLRLAWFRSNGNSNGYGHFQFRLERRSPTLRPTVFRGKGAAICAASGDTIAVWGVGEPVRR